MSLYPFDHLSYKAEYRISIPQRVSAFSKKIEVFNFHLCFFIAELWDFQLKSKLSFFGLIWGRTDLNNFLIFLVKFGGDAIWNLWQTVGSNTEKYLFLIQLTISSYVCLRAKIKTLLENNKFPVLNNKIKTNKLLWIKRCLKNTKLLMAKTISKCMYKDVSELPQHVTQSSYRLSPSLVLRDPLICLWCKNLMKITILLPWYITGDMVLITESFVLLKHNLIHNNLLVFIFLFNINIVCKK